MRDAEEIQEQDSFMNGEEDLTITIPVSVARHYLDSSSPAFTTARQRVQSEISEGISKRDILLVPISRQDAEVWIGAPYALDPESMAVEKRLCAAIRKILDEEDE